MIATPATLPSPIPTFTLLDRPVEATGSGVAELEGAVVVAALVDAAIVLEEVLELGDDVDVEDTEFAASVILK